MLAKIELLKLLLKMVLRFFNVSIDRNNSVEKWI